MGKKKVKPLMPAICPEWARWGRFCSQGPLMDHEVSVEVWKALERLALRKKLVKKAELSRSAGAKTNGPGLRFKSFVNDLILSSHTGARLAKRLARANQIMDELEPAMSLAWEALMDRLEGHHKKKGERQ